METLTWLVLEYPVAAYFAMAVVTGFLMVPIAIANDPSAGRDEKAGTAIAATLFWPLTLLVLLTVGAILVAMSIVSARTPEQRHKRRLAKLNDDWEYEQTEIRISRERDALLARMTREIEDMD